MSRSRRNNLIDVWQSCLETMQKTEKNGISPTLAIYGVLDQKIGSTFLPIWIKIPFIWVTKKISYEI